MISEKAKQDLEAYKDLYKRTRTENVQLKSQVEYYQNFIELLRHKSAEKIDQLATKWRESHEYGLQLSKKAKNYLALSEQDRAVLENEIKAFEKKCPVMIQAGT